MALWKIVSPKLIILTKLLDGHKGTVNAVDMTPDYFVSGSDDMTVKVLIRSCMSLIALDVFAQNTTNSIF